MDSKLLRGYNPLKKILWRRGKREEEKGKMRKLLGDISYSIGVGSEPLWGMRGEKKMSETGGGVSCLTWYISQAR